MKTLVTILALIPFAFAVAANEKEKKKKPEDEIPENLPQPILTSIYPAGGQAGQTVDATVSGTNLLFGSGTNGITALHISGEGVSVTVTDRSKPASVKAAFAISPDAEPGEREVRIATKGGLSNRYRFFVGPLPEIAEVEPNNTLAKAQMIGPLPSVINGQVLQEDRDCFRFAAKAGQALVFRTEARAILPFIADAVPGWFDAVVTLYEGKGKKIAQVDDTRLLPDPVLVFEAPADGEYVIEITDVISRGREDFVYRITAGELPHIDRIEPLGGRRGQKTEVRLFGINLPKDKAAVETGPDTPAYAKFNIRDASLPCNTLLFAVGEYPETPESEPNDSAKTPQRIDVPATINGKIAKPGDTDWYLFKAEANQKLAVEIQSRRLGAPLDSALLISDTKGKELATNDDSVDPLFPVTTHHADARIVQAFPSTGDYLVQIRDTQGAGGDAYGYRLVVAPPNPDFSVRVTPDNPRAPRGDAAILTLSAFRFDGFDGDIEVSADELPEGFGASKAVIQKGQTDGRLTISVPPETPETIVSPVFRATSKTGSNAIEHRAEPAEAAMQAFSYTHILPVRETVLTLTDPIPFRILVETGSAGTIRIPQGGEQPVTIRAERKGELKSNVTLSAQKLPNGITFRPQPIPADKTETAATIIATKQAPAGTRFDLIVSGLVRVGKGSSTSIAPAIPVEIVAP